MSQMQKWIKLVGLGVGMAGIGCLLRSEYERNHLTTTEYVVSSPKLTKEWDGYTIVLLSDLHNKQFGKENAILLEKIKEINPDRILSSGDLICSGKRHKPQKADLSISLRLLKELCKKYPVICGNGNHEQKIRDNKEFFGEVYDWYAKQLKEIGVTYLQNETFQLEGTECNILIRGLDIDSPHYRKKVVKLPLPDSYIEEKLGKASEADFELLVAHSPLFLEEYAKWGADLVCCGHFHGGTIRLPWIGGVMTPQFQFFCKRDKGMHQLGKTTMIVSGGLGTHSINIRFNNLPEIVVIRLQAE